MANLVPTTVALLAHVIERLQAVTEEQLEAPSAPAPSGQLHFMGFATDAQRVMSTLLRKTEGEHRALHEEIDLAFGAHPSLPMEHRRLHVVIKLLEELLYEDLTQTFEQVGERPIYIDSQWRVFWIEQ